MNDGGRGDEQRYEVSTGAWFPGREGVTTEELDKICHAYITAHGGYPSPLNYYNFPKSCCTSVNEVGYCARPRDVVRGV